MPRPFQRFPLVAALLLSCSSVAFAGELPPLTMRAVLKMAAPLQAETVDRLEAARGARYNDDDLPKLLRSDGFTAEYRQTVARYCASAAHAHMLVCAEVHGQAEPAAGASTVR